jgi:hypothetical protein
LYSALAIAGKKCLFLDSSDRYGGSILNFNFHSYLQYSMNYFYIDNLYSSILDALLRPYN